MSENAEQKKKPAFYMAEGVQLHTCKRFCRYVFGSFFYNAFRDEKNFCFNIYIYRVVKNSKGEDIKLEDCVDVDTFVKEWCSRGQWVMNLIFSADEVKELD